ncbi:hypothetical protein ACU5AY_14420 [Rhizobium sp. PAMB 3174]
MGLTAGLFPLSAFAQDEPSGRYQLQHSETGFVRLDTATGEMTYCSEAGGDLTCRPSANERAAYQEEIDDLSRRVLALEQAVKSGVKAQDGLPSDEELDRTLSFMERFFRRFKDLTDEFRAEDEAQPVPKT